MCVFGPCNVEGTVSVNELIASLPNIRVNDDSDEGGGESRMRDVFIDIAVRERVFLALLLSGFMIAAVVTPFPAVAMWVGFAFAGYSVVANDSIQTIGTFLSSNHDKPWWVLWLFIGGIFVATAGYSWWAYGGDVSYQRLAAKGFAEAPTSFSYLQIVAPLFLLILTRMKMPVSTTFLILSCFVSTSKGITSVLTKSLSGYVAAFIVAVVLWTVVTRWTEKAFTGEAHPAWRVAQWLTSGALWAVWIMQDAANVSVYLPRALSLGEFVAFAATLFIGLGILFRLRGDRIQQIITEKTDVLDVRPATLIDLVYAFILYVFKEVNNVPMSTTWVFIGLLAGRELAIAARSRRPDARQKHEVFPLILRDIGYAGVGLAVSMVLAVAINPVIRQELLGF